MKSISTKMLKTLKQAKSRLSAEARQKVADFVLSQDVEGCTDPYYLCFGLMLAYLFDIKVDKKRLRLTLRGVDASSLDLVHAAAYVRSKLIYRLICGRFFLWRGGTERLFFVRGAMAKLSLRRVGEVKFSGYPHSDAHSPYSRFVELAMNEDVGRMVGDKRAIIESLDRYKTPSGGYTNVRVEENATGVAEASATGAAWVTSAASTKGTAIAVSTTSTTSTTSTSRAIITTSTANTASTSNSSKKATPTTNATVAALSVMGQLDGYDRGRWGLDYLLDMQDVSGGFVAAQDAPFPDMLSTATSLFVLSCYGVEPRYPAADFIEAHWLDNGGFSATLAQQQSDTEYTFYGLLALGV